MTALLERERELAYLGSSIEEARSGSGRLVVVEARAGLGKTRLLQAARESAAAAGLRVLAARATELERDFPFALVRQLLAPALAGLPPDERDGVLDGAGAALGALGLAGNDGSAQPGDTFAVLHGLYWVTAALAEREPLVLAIDDAHWADAASLDYLSFLLPRLEELPLLVAVTSRPDEPDAPGGLARVTTDALARRLSPGPLSREAATAVVTGELGCEPDAGFAAACHEVSGGNPFLLGELARTVAAEGIEPTTGEIERVRELAPDRVARTVAVRLDRLSDEARAVARAVAILGDDGDHRLVATLVELGPESAARGADALRAASVLDHGSELRFIHPLVRNAVYVELPAGERAAAHARAAALLRDEGAAPELIATQLVATVARGDRDTVETLLEAGKRALAKGAARSAIAYLTRALREPAPDDLRASVLHPLITASIWAADHTVFDAIERDVFDELERQPSLKPRWATKLTTWMALSGRFDRSAPLLEDAIDVAMAGGDVDRAFRLEAQLNTISQLPLSERAARLERYRGRIEPDSPSGRLEASLDAQHALLCGSADEAADCARRALDGGKVFAEQAELTSPGFNVIVLVFADQLDDAQRGADHARAIGRERGSTPQQVGAWWLNGFVAWARGDLDVAEADLRQAFTLAQLGGLAPAVLMLTAGLMWVLIHRGELDAAETQLESTGMATGAMPENVLVSLLLMARAQLRLEQGRLEEAAEDFLELKRWSQRMGATTGPSLQAGAFAAMALAGLGHRERALELAHEALANARAWGAPSGISRALRARGLAIGGSAGIESLAEAAAVLDGSPVKVERATAMCELGAALRRENRRAEAREPLRAALDLARRCGAGGIARRAFDELQATGERVRRHTPIGVESLTPSERRVAELAASGMTNRQIAQSLFVTVKTVETHLSAAYDKLGIRSRGELADALEDRSGESSSIG